MKNDNVFAADSGKVTTGKRAKLRKPRSIRFFESEWRKIDKLAMEQQISPSELVRQTMIAMSDGKLPAWFDADSALELPAEIRIQIEQMYRGVYILATLKRDEMYREGRQDELDTVHEDAWKTQEAIMESVSDS